LTAVLDADIEASFATSGGVVNQGRVYVWNTDPARFVGGHIEAQVIPLPRLETRSDAGAPLSGTFVEVINAGQINVAEPHTGGTRISAIGNAQPDDQGNFLFDPGHGGGRMDKIPLAEVEFRSRYVQAAHFGEVNTYYHLDRIGSYVDGLLRELGAPGLPRVRAVVNAHHAATEKDGVRDGVWTGKHWRPFQGGHYRLPSKRYDMQEPAQMSPDGEIHLGPGFKLLHHGALVEAAGRRYRHNASHNASTLYHEYGHHITRHTADFRANALRPPESQNNRKTTLDEGTCDYWVATQLGTPHIWAWHRRHDSKELHDRSLSSTKTMADYVDSRQHVHANGTIWAAGLWNVRAQMAASEQNGVRKTDLMVLQALLLLGKREGSAHPQTRKSTSAARGNMTAGLEALLQADEVLYAGRHQDMILATFAERGLYPRSRVSWNVS